MKTVLLGTALFLGGCSSVDTNLAGTGSQTGNTVVSGLVLDSRSNPEAGALVRIRPLTWTDSVSPAPGATSCIKDTVTDSKGRYRFDGLYAGSYRIEARQGGKASILSVKLGTDSVIAPPASLVKTASLVGEVHINDTTRSGRVEIYGVAHFLTLPDTGREIHFRLDSLPPGLHTLRLWSPKLDRATMELPITLFSDSTTVISDEQWSREPKGPEEHDDD